MTQGGVDLSYILVAHYSAAMLPASVAAVRRELATLALVGEVIVVEHSEDPTEQARVATCAPDQLLVRPNRGYAAGVNAGIAAARGRLLIIANPDVELAAGALAPLLAALESWAVVGPQFELAGALFPPAEQQTPGAEVARRWSGAGRGPWCRYLQRQLRVWRRVWEAEAPRSTPTLSGALLALPAALAARVGAWDEAYFLYFEETDWLRRAVGEGARLAVVPAARAVHRWGHSAHPEEWAKRFASSRRRYYSRWFPALGRLVLALPGGAPPVRRAAREAPTGEGWRWLLSPSPRAFPAALAPAGRPLDAAAADLCRLSGRRELTVVGWREDTPSLVGPFVWLLGGTT